METEIKLPSRTQRLCVCTNVIILNDSQWPHFWGWDGSSWACLKLGQFSQDAVEPNFSSWVKEWRGGELQLGCRMCLLLPFMAELLQPCVKWGLKVKCPSGWGLARIGRTSREVFQWERTVTARVKIILLSGSFKNSPCLSPLEWCLVLRWTLMHSKTGSNRASGNS